MKRYILSLLIVPLLLICGFSSANLTEYVEYSLEGCYPQPCEYSPRKSTEGILYFELVKNDGVSAGVEFINSTTKSFNGIGGQIQANLGLQYMFYGRGESGKVGFNIVKPDPPLVPGGTANFTPVITGLTGSINEFIPYVVYIGLGVLGVLIGFVAIKRLINWIRAKIFSSFK